MSNIYHILKLATQVKSRRLKLFGLWLFHITGKRYIGIFLDPVLACNLRCKMCYFSDEEMRKSYKGTLPYEDIEIIASRLFHRALKLQIGCGAEPTIHKDLVRIIALGKRYHVPYVSLTTNGQLLTKELLFAAVEHGLDELTLSTHGFTPSTYEHLMTNARFDLFLRLLADVAEVKKRFPAFRLRINYTINRDNLKELIHLWDVVGDTADIIQLRPIQRIGDSEYKDFNLTTLYEQYDEIITPLIQQCAERHITCLAPNKENILVLEKNNAEDNSIERFTYCYVSAQGCWQEDFDYHTDTFESYATTHQWGKQILAKAFGKAQKKKACVTRKMNYNIK